MSVEKPLTESELEELLEQEIAAQIIEEAERRKATYGVKETNCQGFQRVQTTYIRPIVYEEINDYLSEDERNEYAVTYEKLISDVSKKYVYSNSKINFDDLYSVASVGFVKALNAYRKSTDTLFEVFCIACMKNEIVDFVRSEAKYFNVASLNEKEDDMVFNEPEAVYENDGEYLSMEERVERRNLFEMLNEIIEDIFEPKDQFIIKSYYGLGKIQKRTQIEIGEMLNCTQAYIQKRIKQNIAKLKTVLEQDYGIKKFPF